MHAMKDEHGQTELSGTEEICNVYALNDSREELTLSCLDGNVGSCTTDSIR